MKKIFIVSLCIFASCLSLTMPAQAKILGDFNNSGSLELRDLLIGIRILTGGVLPDDIVEGRITGKVQDSTDHANLASVNVSVSVNGNTFVATTDLDGDFILDTNGIVRGQGYTVHFEKASYQNASRAAVIELANLRSDLGIVLLNKGTTTDNRVIVGKILDNFTENGLANAKVSVQDSNKLTLVAVTNNDGTFQLSGTHFMLGSSYVITVSYPPNYLETSSVIAYISGQSNPVENSSVHLYLKYGFIIGTIMNDNTSEPLVGVSVSSVDSNGVSITASTDAQGKFELKSDHFYLGKTYSVTFSKQDYHTYQTNVNIAFSGENPILNGSMPLMVDAKLSGVAKTSSGVLIPNVLVSVSAKGVDGEPINITTVTNSEGKFIISNPALKKGGVYKLTLSHQTYETFNIDSPALAQGTNELGTLTLITKLLEGVFVSGIVENAYDSSMKIAASVSVIDAENKIRTAESNAQTGVFTIIGSFKKDDTYQLNVSASGYTGDSEVLNTKLNFKIESVSNAVGSIKLYPIGIMVNINGQNKLFTKSLKQSNEKFLTEKTGFTLSGRDSTDYNTSSAFYVHIDDVANPLPTIPKNYNSSLFVAVNGNKTESVIASGLASDPRTNAELGPRNGVKTLPSLKMLNSNMHHFFVTDAGGFAITTYGEISSYLNIMLCDSSGAELSGKTTQINSITLNPGWYFVKVEGVNDTIYGKYQIGVTGPEQKSNQVGTWSTDDLILSYFAQDKGLYIAGKNETGSTGSISIDKMESIGKIARGNFTGTLRIVGVSDEKLSVNGFFNIIRSE